MKARIHELNGARRRGTRHLLPLCWLPLLLVMACVGCRQEAEVAAEINPVGTYTLVSVDGNEVPCTLAHQGHTMSVKSGVFTIDADGTCNSQVAFAAESGEQLSREVKATYTQQGATLTMKWEGAGTTTGTVEGDTFTMNNEGMIFSYRK